MPCGSSRGTNIQGPANDAGLAPEIQTSLTSTCLAAYAIVVSRWDTTQKMLIGTNATTHSSSHFKNVAGGFLNIVPDNANFVPELSFRDFLEPTEEATAESEEYRCAPFRHSKL